MNIFDVKKAPDPQEDFRLGSPAIFQISPPAPSRPEREAEPRITPPLSQVKAPDT